MAAVNQRKTLPIIVNIKIKENNKNNMKFVSHAIFILNIKKNTVSYIIKTCTKLIIQQYKPLSELLFTKEKEECASNLLDSASLTASFHQHSARRIETCPQTERKK